MLAPEGQKYPRGHTYRVGMAVVEMDRVGVGEARVEGEEDTDNELVGEARVEGVVL